MTLLTFWNVKKGRCGKGFGFEDLSIKVSVIALGVLKLMVGISVEAGKGNRSETLLKGSQFYLWEAKVYAS